MLNQMVLLPLVAFGMAIVFGLTEAIAVGVMVLALSPGGVTTNVLTKLAKGNTALSISLTAVVTLLSAVTVPLLVTFSVGYFMNAEAPAIDTIEITKKMFLLTVVPVLLGLALSTWTPRFAAASVKWLSKISVVLFAVIVALAIVAKNDALLANMTTLAPALIVMMLAMLVIGLLSGHLLGLNRADQSTVAIETGIQNGTLGLTVAGVLAAQLMPLETAMSAFAIPSAVYAVLMYAIGIPFVVWRRAGQTKADKPKVRNRRREPGIKTLGMVPTHEVHDSKSFKASAVPAAANTKSPRPSDSL
jgi:BASS family bile acid:Na+ symporter